MLALVDRVSQRLRAGGRVGRIVVLRLRSDDFTVRRARQLSGAYGLRRDFRELRRRAVM